MAAAPNPQAIAGIARNIANLVIFGGATVYGVTNSLFTVEGGHRAIVFNRVVGVKETVGGGAVWWERPGTAWLAVALGWRLPGRPRADVWEARVEVGGMTRWWCG